MRIKKNNTRPVQPDKKYNSTLVTKLINRSMRNGKKAVAAKKVYTALEVLAKKVNKKPELVLEEVVEKISPAMEVRSRRVGGASYQVPMPVSPKRANSLAIRWLIIAANARPNKQYHDYTDKLVAEMQDALQEQGGAIEKRNTAYKMAEANKAFAHFRW